MVIIECYMQGLTWSWLNVTCKGWHGHSWILHTRVDMVMIECYMQGLTWLWLNVSWVINIQNHDVHRTTTSENLSICISFIYSDIQTICLINVFICDRICGFLAPLPKVWPHCNLLMQLLPVDIIQYFNECFQT